VDWGFIVYEEDGTEVGTRSTKKAAIKLTMETRAENPPYSGYD